MSEVKNFINKGKISCNKNILLSIISLATKEISGVASLTNNKKNPIKKLFNRSGFEGVDVQFNPNGLLVIDVYINVFNGYSVPDIAYRVQENVKNSVSSMVEMRTSKVNVHVVGVEFPKEEI